MEEDYYPSLQHEGEKCQLGWAIDAGKKAVMTGVVVSCLPLFLPPLLVISALGLAFSVPYGVVFASYACTHKLMTKLLPSSPTHQDELEAEDNQYSRDETGREEQEEYNNLEIDNDVVKNVEVGFVDEEEKEEEGSLDEKPYFNVIKIDDTKEVENLLQEKIITETKNEGQENGTIDKEREDFPQEKTITETKNEGELKEDQESFGDEKIWEKIDAIRGITGFKAPRRDSYYEELRALYLFTGIEAPPTSIDFVEFYRHGPHINSLELVTNLRDNNLTGELSSSLIEKYGEDEDSSVVWSNDEFAR